MTHLEIFHGLVAAGMKMRYGDKPCRTALLRCLWEKKHIMDAGFVDYYIMAFTLFRHNSASAGIGYWARGAVSSSVVCYCLGLTEIDPIKYGLHSVRFVNDEPPKFQFDIEASRYDEFMKMAEEALQASSEDYDIQAIRERMLQHLKNITPVEYLSRKQEKPIPENIDDELARYSLYFPQTMDLFAAYVNRHHKGDILVYQEQMLDILKKTFHVSSIKANQIRLSIQRGETERVEAYKKEIFYSSDLTDEEKEKAWQRLTSNPKAFLKAHAISHVLASYKYELSEGFINKWEIITRSSEGLSAVRDENHKWGFIDEIGNVVIPFKWESVDRFSEDLAAVKGEQGKWGFINKTGEIVIPFKWKMAHVFREGLAKVVDANNRCGFIDKTGKLVLPCQWKNALWFSEGLAGVKDDNEKWGFIDKAGHVVIPFIWSNVQWFSNGLVRVQEKIGGCRHDIDRNGNAV